MQARALHAQVVDFVGTTLAEWGVEVRNPELQSDRSSEQQK